MPCCQSALHSQSCRANCKRKRDWLISGKFFRVEYLHAADAILVVGGWTLGPDNNPPVAEFQACANRREDAISFVIGMRKRCLSSRTDLKLWVPLTHFWHFQCSYVHLFHCCDITRLAGCYFSKRKSIFMHADHVTPYELCKFFVWHFLSEA